MHGWYWNRSHLYEEHHGAACERASALHLEDLERAGHSPTRTELYIPSESNGRRFESRIDFRSGGYGSPGSMCAES